MRPYDEIKFDWMTYNCGHFTREVWLELTGVDLGLRMPERLTREALVNAFVKGESEVVGKLIQEIPEPVDPCLVMLQSGRCVPHVGVYTAGALLHLPKDGKVEHRKLDDVMSAGRFTSARFFR